MPKNFKPKFPFNRRTIRVQCFPVYSVLMALGNPTVDLFRWNTIAKKNDESCSLKIPITFYCNLNVSLFKLKKHVSSQNPGYGILEVFTKLLLMGLWCCIKCQGSVSYLLTFMPFFASRFWNNTIPKGFGIMFL